MPKNSLVLSSSDILAFCDMMCESATDYGEPQRTTHNTCGRVDNPDGSIFQKLFRGFARDAHLGKINRAKWFICAEK